MNLILRMLLTLLKILILGTLNYLIRQELKKEGKKERNGEIEK